MRHPILEADRVMAMIDDFSGSLTNYVEEMRGQHPTDLSRGEVVMLDETRQALETVVDGRVGTPYSRETLDELMREGQKRLDDSIPPGYLDGDKPAPECYGDFIFWSRRRTAPPKNLDRFLSSQRIQRTTGGGGKAA
jgi:PIN like domain